MLFVITIAKGTSSYSYSFTNSEEAYSKLVSIIQGMKPYSPMIWTNDEGVVVFYNVLLW